MMEREYFYWVAKVQQGENGNTYAMTIRNLWSPSKIEIDDIARTAAAEATYATGIKHIGLSAVQTTEAAAGVKRIPAKSTNPKETK
jgi:hypothetical protein